ncbi:hypothetical protein Nepgr_014028 [Nepenthes gracilis]|uniref:Uncharacterized protein n=1 Tax=Nepenthes gracilis TaxID=150966 RepID=A0AAD3SJC3_NEPGR|nr:hypothetical protein Nepgr_014028 [Nepenthes gracilis]
MPTSRRCPTSTLVDQNHGCCHLPVARSPSAPRVLHLSLPVFNAMFVVVFSTIVGHTDANTEDRRRLLQASRHRKPSPSLLALTGLVPFLAPASPAHDSYRMAQRSCYPCASTVAGKLCVSTSCCNRLSDGAIARFAASEPPPSSALVHT